MNISRKPDNVPLLKSIILTTILVFGISAGPAQAFFPMMLFMLPMMHGEQHAMGESHGSSRLQGTQATDLSRKGGESEQLALHEQQRIESLSITEEGAKQEPISHAPRRIISSAGATPESNDVLK